MSALALIFSSDGFVVSRVRDAFKRLGLQTELGREVFYCLEALTSRHFDVIAIDWSEGPEALFLFKTARDVKHNRGAFSVLLANSSDFTEAQNSGADLVVRSSAASEEIVNSLLACEKFQVLVETGVKKSSVPKVDLSKIYDDDKSAPSAALTDGRKAPIFAEEILPVEPLAMVSDRQPTFPISAYRDSYLVSERLGCDSSNECHRSALPQSNRNVSPFLRIAVLIFTLLCFVYSLAQPLVAKAVFTAATETCIFTLQKAQILFHPTRPLNKVNVEIEAYKEWEKPSFSHIESRHNVAVSTRGPTVSLEPGGELAAAKSFEDAQVVRNPTRPEIPDSLRVPLRVVPSTGPVVARPGSLLAHGLGTITLPSEVSQKLLLDKLPPAYPQQALRQGVEGAVVVQALIGTDGSIESLKLIRGPLVLGAAACKAIKQWRYKPYFLNGQAVEAQTYVTVDFKLPEEVVKAEIRN